ncbi:MAG TPA: BamA/TamA family outer membrane protein [Bryobacteraceae bacterium]|nr:BamA/TamA family outer membrane protein [Bryobacteraceae bacterium]
MLLGVAAAGTLASAQEPSAFLQDALKYEGQRIVQIDFEPGDQPLSRDELMKALPFHAGDAFHERALREAIQNLYASGRFADLAVDAREAGDGVALRFLTEAAYFVGRVAVLGVKSPPNSGELASATKLALGRRYLETDKNQGMEAIKVLLRANGYYRASVAAVVNFDRLKTEANVRFGVGTGKRARFEHPEITGDAQQSDEAITRATHWKRLYGWLGWQEATEARMRQGLENVRRYYEKHNLLESRITLARLDYHYPSNTVKPVLDIQAGPRIVIRVTGASIGMGDLRQLVPVYQEHSVDEDLLTEGQHNIEQFLRSQGYFEASVEFSNVPGPGEQTITYRVTRGARYKFVHLGIAGNHYFDWATIRERLYMQPAEFPRFPYGRFNEVYLRQDVQSIQNLYAQNGFKDVKVSSRVETDYHSVKHHLAVFLSIEEGPQWFVSELSIEGAGPADLPALTPMLASIRGQPFSEASVAEDRENLLDYYYDRGYPSATFDYYVAPAAEAHHVAIRYVLQPGPRKYVRDVFVSGLETTRKKLVDRRIELKKGAPLSLDEETDSQRRLYDLGIFARVNTALEDPDGDEADKNVLYDIDEARHYSLNVGVGAQIARLGGGVTSLDNPAGTTGFAPRLAVGLSRLNFLGLGQTVGVQTSVSTIEQRGALTYFIPQFISNENLSLTFTALLDDSSDIRTFTSYRREASIQLGERLSRAYSVQYRFVFRHVTLSNLKIDQLLVPLLSQPETVGLGEFSIIEDKRDDPTDAHHGVYTTLDLAYAPAFLGSQTQFARGLFRNSTYYTLHRDLVLARSTQFGLIQRTGGRAQIPLAERLYSGGSTSIRAFPDFQAGPRDLTTGFPLGGNALFINNTELRFPLYGDNLRGVVFEDAGNVYGDISDFSLRFRQRNLQDFNYTVQDVGFGIRYRTPIGPVRVDLSLSPDAPRFFGLKGTEQDYLNGTATPAVQKINGFQFHISLGQAF